MHQPAELQVDATLAIRDAPGWQASITKPWQRGLGELVEVDRYIDIELDVLGRNARDVQVVEVITETITVDVTDCQGDVPDRIDAADWYAILDEDMVVDGRRLVRFDVFGRE